MKYAIALSMVAAVVSLAACQRETVVQPPVVLTVPVPGPAGEAGATGATGNTGNTGQTGKTGDTLVILPPATPQR